MAAHLQWFAAGLPRLMRRVASQAMEFFLLRFTRGCDSACSTEQTSSSWRSSKRDGTSSSSRWHWATSRGQSFSSTTYTRSHYGEC